MAPAIARDATGTPTSHTTATVAASAAAGFGGTADRPTARATVHADGRAARRVQWLLDGPTRSIDQISGRQTEIRPATTDVPVAKPVAIARTTPTTTTATSSGSARPSYHGRNHVWIPSLGVSRSISFFSCSSNAYPGNRVYRWGCAGTDNVYLFGHAGSVFAPLHDAYVSGRLRKGMALYYANGDGVVHRYAVRWWKVTTPDKGAWAYASQSTPSLTLQTCVGARSQFRLIVRLVQSD